MPPRNSRYPQIAAQLRDRILAGDWPTDTRLPTLDELAEEYGANKNTILRAINEVLEPEGLVWTAPKRGIVVRPAESRRVHAKVHKEVPHKQVKFRMIADDLEARIRAGEFEPGSRLPSKAELMSHYRKMLGTVALGTLDKAFALLREQELIETKRGSGTYVRDPLPVSKVATTVPDDLAELRSRIAVLEAQVAGLLAQEAPDEPV